MFFNSYNILENADMMSERVEAAREQLCQRGYRKNAELSNGSCAVTLEQWTHAFGPAVIFTHDGRGWDLYIEADTTNRIDATWAALDARIKPEVEAEVIKVSDSKLSHEPFASDVASVKGRAGRIQDESP